MDMQKYLTIKVKNCYDYNPVGKLFEVFEKGREPIKLDKIMNYDEEKTTPDEETTEETTEEEVKEDE